MKNKSSCALGLAMHAAFRLWFESGCSNSQVEEDNVGLFMRSLFEATLSVC